MQGIDMIEDKDAMLQEVLTQLRKVSLQGEAVRQRIDEASSILLKLWREEKRLLREAHQLIGGDIPTEKNAAKKDPGLVERLPGMFVESSRLPLLRSAVSLLASSGPAWSNSGQAGSSRANPATQSDSSAKR